MLPVNRETGVDFCPAEICLEVYIMPRKPIKKELVNTRLLKEYASWVYCDKCSKTVAYLCYVTYNSFDFTYKCNCRNTGCVHIEFENANSEKKSEEPLLEIKNRLCCRNDHSPLVTVVAKNLQSYKLSLVCRKCNTRYQANS